MLIRLLLLLYGACVAVSAAALTWETETPDTYKAYQMRYGAKMVDDDLSSTNKALRIPHQPGTNGWNVEMSTRELTLRGKNLVTLHVRGEGMLPLSDGLEIIITAHDKTTGIWAAHASFPIYGINLKQDGYTALTFLLDTGMTATTFRSSSLLIKWRVNSPGIEPVLYLDYADIRPQVFTGPFLTDVSPAKVRYAPGEKVSASITIANPTGADAALKVVGEERWGLTGKRLAFTQQLIVKAGETRTATAAWKLGAEEYGREIAVALLAGETVVDSASALFAVTKTPLWLSTSNERDGAGVPPNTLGFFFVAPATIHDSLRGIQYAKKNSPGSENWEYFSWAPGDIADLAPVEDPFPGGEGRFTYRSKTLLQRQNALLTQAGFWPVSYVNGTAWADAGYRLFQQRPEWFLFDATGEVGHYSMLGREIYRRKDDAVFDPESYPRIHFQAVLNHALPEVQDYIARQYIACGRGMGFKGVRMDVRYLEVYPGERDFSGQEVALTYAEADRISAAAVKRVKALVRKELPDFTFGYNYAAPEEVEYMPLTMRERCADGGWMLDELPCTYQAKSSPYHYWTAYVRRMTSWGDQINKWDGIYNPFDFRRGSTPYPVDKIYSTIFRLIAGGRIACYHNSRQPIGNLGNFSTRYSECFFGRQRDWLPEIKDEVDVKTDTPLWWRDMVYWNRATDGSRQLLVNLVNPPKAEEVEENPTSELRPPVRDIMVTCAPLNGKRPKAAWLLAAEPMEPTEQPALRQIPLLMKLQPNNHVTVTVPSVIFYKLVVFQY